MSKLYLGKINCSKIDKARLFEGKEGKWMDVTIWISEEPDKYGNQMAIQQSTKKDETKIYLGNAKEWEAKPELKNNEGEWVGKKEVPPMSDTKDLENLPF